MTARTNLHEPVGVIQVVFVDVAKALRRLGRQMFPALANVEADGREILVRLRAEENQFIGPPAPRVTHDRGFRRQVFRGSHHPDQHAHFFEQPFRYCVVV